jgi:hypothetical protein
MSGRHDDAERVANELVGESRRKGLADVEATALNQLVRIAILRGDLAQARSRLRDAVACAAALNIEYVRVDCVLSYARILSRERRANAAAPLLRSLLERPDLEPVDRDEVQACLQALPSPLRESAAAQAPLESLLEQIAGELAAPAAAR